MDNTLFSGTNELKAPFGLSESQFQEIGPRLTPNNIECIKKEYKRIDRTPSYDELKIYAAILEARRRSATGYLISGLKSDSIALRETYSDLMQKANAVFEKKTAGLSLDEAAYICGEYMRYIGRRDRLTPICSDTDGVGDNALSLFGDDGGAALVFGKKTKKNKPPRVGKIGNGYAVLLLDGEEYDLSSASFFSDREVDLSYNFKVKIGAYGLVGALCALTRGARVDTARLSSDIPRDKLLTGAFWGKHLVFCPKNNIKPISDKAVEYGLNAIYFANTKKDEMLTTRDMAMPMRLLRALSDSTTEVTVSPVEPNLSTSHKRPVTAQTKDGSSQIADDGLTAHGGRIISPIHVCPDENSFGEAVNSLTDALLSLVARGVDRRAVCSAVSYELLRRGISEKELGESLALILGVYRVGVELALSEGITDVKYTDRRSLLAALYAEKPRHIIENKFVKNGSRLALLSLGTGSDGLVDFSDIRSVCDRFTELCKEGKVYSARAVSGDLSAVIDAMSGVLTAELSNEGKALTGIGYRGILFETDGDSELNMIGKVINTPHADVNLTDC